MKDIYLYCSVGILMFVIAIVFFTSIAFPQQEEIVGERPYEMIWANRTKDHQTPLVDFEDLTGWRIETKNAEASFIRSREQQIWGKYVGKLTYRATGEDPEIRILPSQPVKIENPFDAVTCWIYGNNWSFSPDHTTPPIVVNVIIQTPDGKESEIYLTSVCWKEWFLVHRRLNPEQIKSFSKGSSFNGFLIRNATNKEDRVVYFDNLAVFIEKFPRLKFQPRPQRGIPMFQGQTVGTNTGPGKLPFPTRIETILPDNLTKKFRTFVYTKDNAFIFTYEGSDGKLTYQLQPKTGTLGDISAKWSGRGGLIYPCVGGGVYLVVDSNKYILPEKAEHLGTEIKGEIVVSSWRVWVGETSAEVSYIYRIWNKSLVIDVVALGGRVGEVRYGRAVGLENPRLVTNPYYHYGSRARPAVVVSGPSHKPLFLAGNTDWYLSNASILFAENSVSSEGVVYNGGTRYIPKTDGKRNDCYERFFITISPRYEEVLPNIPNPKSPWMDVAGTRVWRAHGASSNREADIRFWRQCHRYGMTQVVITDHETMWRDGGESFTFRTRAAPKKGGDKGAYDYARILQDELGFIYGPYNNFTDFAPVNEYWDIDHVSRTSENQLQLAWPRCYAPKPARAVEFCAMLSPKIQKKFHFSTAYCDVHTAVAPWWRVDYDYRVPGAGTFLATFYSFGEIMLLQKSAWNGPVYSEGNLHYLYCGLTDGNYAQDQSYKLPTNPWLVDFDLRKMHHLCCNFGMGNLKMFYGKNYRITDVSIDRFLAATIAFGHTGFLIFEGGYHNALRSYYMLQQLHSKYAISSAKEIRYADSSGKLFDTTAAVANEIYKRSQIVTRYSDGTITAVNGNPTERMKVKVYGRRLDLPPNGYAGWTEDGLINVLSSDPKGHRCDYAVTPAYIYVDGRGKFVRFEKAASNGIGICCILGNGKYEIIPYKAAECGFGIGMAKATALDRDGNVIGPAEVRVARGLTYIMPVDNAFSYLLDTISIPVGTELRSDYDEVFPGQRVVVYGKKKYEVCIPTNVVVGDRLWYNFEDSWIDFTVIPFAYTNLSVKDNKLYIELVSNLKYTADVTVAMDGRKKTLRFKPGFPTTVIMDLGPLETEGVDTFNIELYSDRLRQEIECVIVKVKEYLLRAFSAEEWRGGICLRGQKETFDFGETNASVTHGPGTCNGLRKKSLLMHPPYIGGVGYSFALSSPLTLPVTPKAIFRAMVGKRDGSYRGDGILYKISIIDESGKETIVGEKTVCEHEWVPIEGDLSSFAGKTVTIKLISDVGKNDNSIGDWACWSEMRIETLEPRLIRKLAKNVDIYRLKPPPFRIQGITVDELRKAKKGWLHYDGMGLSGVGEYGSFAVLNGVELGSMAEAGGDEVKGAWEENVSVPLTSEAIKTLELRNRFVLRNPRRDWFKVRNFWIELELADGRKCSSEISATTYTQPPGWPYAEGISIPFDEEISVEIWFKP